MQKPTERIVSRQNSLLTLVTSLTERKYRTRERLFRFDGKKLFLEALAAGLPLTAVLLRESSADALLREAGDRELTAGCRTVLLPDALFERISEERSPEGVICVSRYLDKIHKIITIDGKEGLMSSLCEGPALFLESLRDPGNLGTVIRSSAAFGVANLILSADCADLYHPRTIRAAMGTLFHRSVILVEDVAAAIQLLRTRGRVYAAALQPDAVRLPDVRFGRTDTVLIGNEGHGLSLTARSLADAALYIPMEPGVESLNAGIAASLVLFEFYREM